MLVVSDALSVPLQEFRFTFSRSGGPGGQNVNKLNTKATLHWDVTSSPSVPDDVRERFVQKHRRRLTKDGVLVLTSQRFRDQGRNVADCLAKLREMLVEAERPPKKRRPTKLPRAVKEKRLADKRRRKERKLRRRPPAADDS